MLPLFSAFGVCVVLIEKCSSEELVGVGRADRTRTLISPSPSNSGPCFAAPRLKIVRDAVDHFLAPATPFIVAQRRLGPKSRN